MPESHQIRCRCGKLQGELDLRGHATRAVCYCRDCQAYAVFIGSPEVMLDALGGTEIIAVQPQYVHFTQGLDQLACVSLTENGPYRWYSSCCRTPIGNAPRNIKVAHVGLVGMALSHSGSDLSASFGAVAMRVYPESARGVPPRNNKFKFVVAVVGYLTALLTARLTGSYRINPFFNVESGTPRVAPGVLTEEQRQELMRAAP